MAKKSKFGAFARFSLLAASVICLPMAELVACGLAWKAPVNHFDGVNEQGYVSYWEKVSEVDFGDNLKLPLIIGFKSNRETLSPYLGKSWLMPLIESNFTQINENAFQLVQPDGFNNYFMRKQSDDTILQGSGGWKAEIKGDTIAVWATCGWKMEYYKGHIVSITTPKNRKLEFIYTGSSVTAIRENGTTKFSVEQVASGEVGALVFNGKRIAIAMDQKPKVENIAGQNVVSGIDRSLKMLSPSEGTSRVFEFSVNEKMQPTLKIINEMGTQRLFTWDSVSKRIVTDNEWVYKVDTSKTGLGNAAISRINSKAQSEYWVHDTNSGVETSQDINGVKTIKYTFVSGNLAGKLRKVERIIGGKTETLLSNAYDDQGRLVRIKNGLSIAKIFYRSESGWDATLKPALERIGKYSDVKEIENVKVSFIGDNSKAWYTFYDKNKNIIAELEADGKVKHYASDKISGKRMVYLDDELKQAFVLYPNGKFKEAESYVNGVIRRKSTMKYEKTTNGERKTTETLVDYKTGKSSQDTRTFDTKGRIIEFATPSETFHYSYDENGKRQVSVTKMIPATNTTTGTTTTTGSTR